MSKKATNMMAGGEEDMTVIMTVGTMSKQYGYYSFQYGSLNKIPYWLVGGKKVRLHKLCTYYSNSTTEGNTTIIGTYNDPPFDFTASPVYVTIAAAPHGDLAEVTAEFAAVPMDSTVEGSLIPNSVGEQILLTFTPPPDGFL